MRFTWIDMLRRKPHKPTREGFLATKPDAWGPTLPPHNGSDVYPWSPPIQVRRQGCIHRESWYNVPRGTPDNQRLYVKCGYCGDRWNPWPPGHPKFSLAAKAIGHEISLEFEGDPDRDVKNKIDLTALGPHHHTYLQESRSDGAVTDDGCGS